MPTNILITDYYCASNRGDAAILEGVYQSLQEVYPDADITVMTEHPEAAELIHGLEAVDQTFAGFDWALSKKNLARGFLLGTSPLYNRGVSIPGFEQIRKRGNLQPYLDADLVVSTGGQFLTDIYFPSKVAVLWEHYYLARIDTPVVIYAQTLGPFERPLYRRLSKYVLDQIDLVLTRDEPSKDIVEDLGISTPVHCTADAAFAMDTDRPRPAPLDTMNADDQMPPQDETTVSISVREWKHSGGDTTQETYAQAFADLADWLVSERDVNVVFASTCTGLDGYNKDDRLFAASVVDRMEYGEGVSVQILSGEYRPHELVAVYEQMDLHVGMRMHSNILAMLAETPVIPIEYQFKTSGLMAQFGLSDYLLSVEALDTETLIGAVDRGLSEREHIARTVESTLPEVRSKARESADLVDAVTLESN